jgi:nucleotide-binding universal stress UspA family protein
MANDDVPLARPVVVATDFSSASLAAIDAAAWLAGRAPLEVHLVHVFDDSVPVPLAQGGFEGDDETRRRLWEALSGIRAERFPDNPRVATAVLTARSAVDGLCAYAAQHAAGLMVVGTHGRTGISRLLIGSVAERVVRQAPCSVLCVRNRES